MSPKEKSVLAVSVFQASSFATVVVYVMDTSRSINPVTFMSNMLYACSILYKTKLPFLIAMNKVQVILIVTPKLSLRNKAAFPHHEQDTVN